MGLGQEEVVSRKEYLKKKKRQKRKTIFDKMGKRTWLMLAFILAISCYVIYQFGIYNKKHRLVQTLPDEISSMKEYKIYYVSESYTYDGKNQLKSMSTTSNEKETIDEGLGITQITIKDNHIYGIIDGSLVKIIKDGRKNKVEKLVENNVKGYCIYGENVYAYMEGEGVETGIYKLGKKNKTEKIISVYVNQLLIDKNNIYVVNGDKNIIKYDKDGKNETIVVNNGSAVGVIQDLDNIYFVNAADNNKLYRVVKETGEISHVTNEGTTCGWYTGMNGYAFMGVYDNTLYYINTKDGNKLYKTVVGSSEDIKILEDNIQILDVINSTIFYKVVGDIGVYRYDTVNEISSQVTSARVVEFAAEE